MARPGRTVAAALELCVAGAQAAGALAVPVTPKSGSGHRDVLVQSRKDGAVIFLCCTSCAEPHEMLLDPPEPRTADAETAPPWILARRVWTAALTVPTDPLVEHVRSGGSVTITGHGLGG